MSDPFDSGTAGISLALDVPFPANVTSGPGVKVDKTTGTWSISLDTPPLADIGIPPNPSALYLAVYDSTLPGYEKVRLDNIISGATGLDSYTPRGDADYSILGGLTPDRYVALTATLTAVRTWTFPAAASVPAGRLIAVQDEAGGISGINHLRFLPSGSDTIDGLSVYRLKAKYGGLTFRSDGISKWSVFYAGQITLVADVAYTVLQGDINVAYSSITAPRIVSLPTAAAYQAGQRLTILDQSGSCSLTNTISINRAGADTINGATSQVLNSGYGIIAIVSDGVSKWTIVDGGLAGSISGSSIVGGAINNVPIGPTTPSTGAFTSLTSTSGALNGTIGAATPGTGAFTTLSASGASTLAALSAGPLTVNATPFVIPAQCRLTRQDATHLILKPYNGNMIKISGNMYPIPAAGITLASGTFSASTFYYIYALQTAGVVSLENSATAHSTDSSAGNVGVEIKTGDNTRTLVGAVMTDGSTNFVDTDASRLVISWFNRQPKRLQNAFTAIRTTTSLSWAEINTEIRCNFLTWADDVLRMSANGFVSNSTTQGTISTIGVDGLTPSISSAVFGTNGAPLSLTDIRTGIAEGASHYATLLGAVGGASTGTWTRATGALETWPTLVGSIMG